MNKKCITKKRASTCPVKKCRTEDITTKDSDSMYCHLIDKHSTYDHQKTTDSDSMTFDLHYCRKFNLLFCNASAFNLHNISSHPQDYQLDNIS
eukprot:1609671-Ditylum_brightwellii.AAC.1